MIKSLAILTIALWLSAPTLAQQASRVAVFVRADDSSGFVEPDLLDSMKDIQREIPKRRNLRLAARVEDATLVVVVTKRYVSDGNQTTITLPGTVTTTATQIGNTTTATTTVAPPIVLALGTYVVESIMYIKPNDTIAAMAVAAAEGAELPRFVTRPVVGAVPGGGWRYIARTVAVDIERWVSANQEALK